jgi:hypothetical protein
MPFDDEKKIKRLKEKESKLVSKGYKAVDEGRDKKADRILGRAANLENRIITLEEKDNMPMKNSAIDIFNKKRYDISREFDGQEVPGTLTVRPTISGGTVETERFNMPGGGTSMSRTRMNDKGQPVRRVVKDKKINK